MRRSLPKALAAGLVLVALAPVPAPADTTTRVYGSAGSGWVDETRASDGTVVRRQAYREDGKLRSDTRYDRGSGKPTGSTEHTYDESGNRETTTQRNGEGDPTETSRFDSNGHLVRHEKFGDVGQVTQRREYRYDENGDLRDINVFDENDRMSRSYHYTWKDGKLEDATEMDLTKDPPETVGIVFYRSDGSVEEIRGNPKGALAQLGISVDLDGHTTIGADGSRTTVRHNPDGTYDVTVVHPDQRVTGEHLRHGAGCPLGDACPFEDSEGVREAATEPKPAAEESRSGSPISRLPPARIGGTPAPLPPQSQRPSVDVQQHPQP